MEIKIASEEKEIYEILSICKEDFYNQKLNTEESIQFLANKFYKNARVVYATENEKVQGFIAYYSNDTETKVGFVSMIIVKSNLQGMGVGTELLQYAEDDCRNKGMNCIRLEVAVENKKAREFYRKKAFFETMLKNNESIYLEKII